MPKTRTLIIKWNWGFCSIILLHSALFMFFETIVVKTSTEGKLTRLQWPPTHHNALQRLCLLQLSVISDGYIIFSSDKKYIYIRPWSWMQSTSFGAPKCLTERCTLLCIACKADLLALIITNAGKSYIISTLEYDPNVSQIFKNHQQAESFNFKMYICNCKSFQKLEIVR